MMAKPYWKEMKSGYERPLNSSEVALELAFSSAAITKAIVVALKFAL